MGSNKGLVSPISHGTGFVSQLTRHAAERWGGFRGRTWRASADPAIDSQLRHAALPENYAALRTPPPRGLQAGEAGCPFLSFSVSVPFSLPGISGALSRTSERGQSRGIPAASARREWASASDREGRGAIVALDAKKPLPGVALARSAYSVNDRRAAAVSTSHPGPSGRFTGASATRPLAA
ncbi:hypothetical protein MTO96_018131 [Rhipicephalus appendiculatus]